MEGKGEIRCASVYVEDATIGRLAMLQQLESQERFQRRKEANLVVFCPERAGDTFVEIGVSSWYHENPPSETETAWS